MFEKNEIATRYLFPKQVAAHGLGPDHIEVADGVVHHVVDKYTREAGVRSLNRRLGDLCRSIAVDVVKLPEAERLGAVFPLDMGRVEKALGPVRYISEVSQREDQEGVATGLAWTAVGGDILFIEVQAMKGGKGEVTLTGQLGDVMKESVRAALSYLRAHGDLYGVDTNMIKSHDLHIHVPAGAIPKDGPSAGITMFSALLSRFAGLKLRREVAMTGEITLTGQVLPVGGIKEKVIAAHRAGIREVIMPSQCTKDLRDVDALVLSEMTFYPVDRVEQIPPLVFRDVLRDWTKALPVTEPFVQEPSV
jgi:ATP-dependent Lon protease